MVRRQVLLLTWGFLGLKEKAAGSGLLSGVSKSGAHVAAKILIGSDGVLFKERQKRTGMRVGRRNICDFQAK